MSQKQEDHVGMLAAALEQRLQGMIQVLRADQERLATEQLRALLRTAEAVEQMAHQGVKLQEQPPAVWGA